MTFYQASSIVPLALPVALEVVSTMPWPQVDNTKWSENRVHDKVRILKAIQSATWIAARLIDMPHSCCHDWGWCCVIVTRESPHKLIKGCICCSKGTTCGRCVSDPPAKSPPSVSAASTVTATTHPANRSTQNTQVGHGTAEGPRDLTWQQKIYGPKELSVAMKEAHNTVLQAATNLARIACQTDNEALCDEADQLWVQASRLRRLGRTKQISTPKLAKNENKNKNKEEVETKKKVNSMQNDKKKEIKDNESDIKEQSKDTSRDKELRPKKKIKTEEMEEPDSSDSSDSSDTSDSSSSDESEESKPTSAALRPSSSGPAWPTVGFELSVKPKDQKVDVKLKDHKVDVKPTAQNQPTGSKSRPFAHK